MLKFVFILFICETVFIKCQHADTSTLCAHLPNVGPLQNSEQNFDSHLTELQLSPVSSLGIDFFPTTDVTELNKICEYLRSEIINNDVFQKLRNLEPKRNNSLYGGAQPPQTQQLEEIIGRVPEQLEEVNGDNLNTYTVENAGVERQSKYQDATQLDFLQRKARTLVDDGNNEKQLAEIVPVPEIHENDLHLKYEIGDEIPHSLTTETTGIKPNYITQQIFNPTEIIITEPTTECQIEKQDDNKYKEKLDEPISQTINEEASTDLNIDNDEYSTPKNEATTLKNQQESTLAQEETFHKTSRECIGDELHTENYQELKEDLLNEEEFSVEELQSPTVFLDENKQCGKPEPKQQVNIPDIILQNIDDEEHEQEVTYLKTPRSVSEDGRSDTIEDRKDQNFNDIRKRIQTHKSIQSPSSPSKNDETNGKESKQQVQTPKPKEIVEYELKQDNAGTEEIIEKDPSYENSGNEFATRYQEKVERNLNNFNHKGSIYYDPIILNIQRETKQRSYRNDPTYIDKRYGQQHIISEDTTTNFENSSEEAAVDDIQLTSEKIEDTTQISLHKNGKKLIKLVSEETDDRPLKNSASKTRPNKYQIQMYPNRDPVSDEKRQITDDDIQLTSQKIEDTTQTSAHKSGKKLIKLVSEETDDRPLKNSASKSRRNKYQNQMYHKREQVFDDESQITDDDIQLNSQKMKDTTQSCPHKKGKKLIKIVSEEIEDRSLKNGAAKSRPNKYTNQMFHKRQQVLDEKCSEESSMEHLPEILKDISQYNDGSSRNKNIKLVSVEIDDSLLKSEEASSSIFDTARYRNQMYHKKQQGTNNDDTLHKSRERNFNSIGRHVANKNGGVFTTESNYRDTYKKKEDTHTMDSYHLHRHKDTHEELEIVDQEENLTQLKRKHKKQEDTHSTDSSHLHRHKDTQYEELENNVQLKGKQTDSHRRHNYENMSVESQNENYKNHLNEHKNSQKNHRLTDIYDDGPNFPHINVNQEIPIKKTADKFERTNKQRENYSDIENGYDFNSDLANNKHRGFPSVISDDSNEMLDIKPHLDNTFAKVHHQVPISENLRPVNEPLNRKGNQLNSPFGIERTQLTPHTEKYPENERQPIATVSSTNLAENNPERTQTEPFYARQPYMANNPHLNPIKFSDTPLNNHQANNHQHHERETHFPDNIIAEKLISNRNEIAHHSQNSYSERHQLESHNVRTGKFDEIPSRFREVQNLQHDPKLEEITRHNINERIPDNIIAEKFITNRNEKAHHSQNSHSENHHRESHTLRTGKFNEIPSQFKEVQNLQHNPKLGGTTTQNINERVHQSHNTYEASRQNVHAMDKTVVNYDENQLQGIPHYFNAEKQQNSVNEHVYQAKNAYENTKINSYANYGQVNHHQDQLMRNIHTADENINGKSSVNINNNGLESESSFIRNAGIPNNLNSNFYVSGSKTENLQEKAHIEKEEYNRRTTNIQDGLVEHHQSHVNLDSRHHDVKNHQNHEYQIHTNGHFIPERARQPQIVTSDPHHQAQTSNSNQGWERFNENRNRNHAFASETKEIQPNQHTLKIDQAHHQYSRPKLIAETQSQHLGNIHSNGNGDLRQMGYSIIPPQQNNPNMMKNVVHESYNKRNYDQQENSMNERVLIHKPEYPVPNLPQQIFAAANGHQGKVGDFNKYPIHQGTQAHHTHQMHSNNHQTSQTMHTTGVHSKPVQYLTGHPQLYRFDGNQPSNINRNMRSPTINGMHFPANNASNVLNTGNPHLGIHTIQPNLILPGNIQMQPGHISQPQIIHTKQPVELMKLHPGPNLNQGHIRPNFAKPNVQSIYPNPELTMELIRQALGNVQHPVTNKATEVWPNQNPYVPNHLLLQNNHQINTNSSPVVPQNIQQLPYNPTILGQRQNNNFPHQIYPIMTLNPAQMYGAVTAYNPIHMVPMANLPGQQSNNYGHQLQPVLFPNSPNYNLNTNARVERQTPQANTTTNAHKTKSKDQPEKKEKNTQQSDNDEEKMLRFLKMWQKLQTKPIHKPIQKPHQKTKPSVPKSDQETDKNPPKDAFNEFWIEKLHELEKSKQEDTIERQRRKLSEDFTKESAPDKITPTPTKTRSEFTKKDDRKAFYNVVYINGHPSKDAPKSDQRINQADIRSGLGNHAQEMRHKPDSALKSPQSDTSTKLIDSLLPLLQNLVNKTEAKLAQIGSVSETIAANSATHSPPKRFNEEMYQPVQGTNQRIHSSGYDSLGSVRKPNHYAPNHENYEDLYSQQGERYNYLKPTQYASMVHDDKAYNSNFPRPPTINKAIIDSLDPQKVHLTFPQLEAPSGKFKRMISTFDAQRIHLTPHSNYLHPFNRNFLADEELSSNGKNVDEITNGVIKRNINHGKINFSKNIQASLGCEPDLPLSGEKQNQISIEPASSKHPASIIITITNNNDNTNNNNNTRCPGSKILKSKTSGDCSPGEQVSRIPQKTVPEQDLKMKSEKNLPNIMDIMTEDIKSIMEMRRKLTQDLMMNHLNSPKTDSIPEAKAPENIPPGPDSVDTDYYTEEEDSITAAPIVTTKPPPPRVEAAPTIIGIKKSKIKNLISNIQEKFDKISSKVGKIPDLAPPENEEPPSNRAKKPVIVIKKLKCAPENLAELDEVPCKKEKCAEEINPKISRKRSAIYSEVQHEEYDEEPQETIQPSVPTRNNIINADETPTTSEDEVDNKLEPINGIVYENYYPNMYGFSGYNVGKKWKVEKRRGKSKLSKYEPLLRSTRSAIYELKTPPQRVHDDSEETDLLPRPSLAFDESGVNFPDWFANLEGVDQGEPIVLNCRSKAKAARHKLWLMNFYKDIFKDNILTAGHLIN